MSSGPQFRFIHIAYRVGMHRLALVFLAAFLFSAITYSFSARILPFYLSGVQTVGQVVEIVPLSGSTGRRRTSQRARVVVEYVAIPSGASYRKGIVLSGPLLSPLSLGQDIALIFRAQAPDHVLILPKAYLGVLSFSGLLLAACLLYLRLRWRKPTAAFFSARRAALSGYAHTAQVIGTATSPGYHAYRGPETGLHILYWRDADGVEGQSLPTGLIYIGYLTPYTWIDLRIDPLTGHPWWQSQILKG